MPNIFKNEIKYKNLQLFLDVGFIFYYKEIVENSFIIYKETFFLELLLLLN